MRTLQTSYDLPLDGSYTAQQTSYRSPCQRLLTTSSWTCRAKPGTTDVRIYTTGEFNTIGHLISDSDSDNDGYLDDLAYDDNSFGSLNFSLLASLLARRLLRDSFRWPHMLIMTVSFTGTGKLHAARRGQSRRRALSLGYHGGR